MSVGYTIESGGTLESVDKQLLKLSKFDMASLLRVVGAEVESQTRIRIQEEKRSPEGELWPSLAFSTEERYEDLGKSTDRSRLLQFEGRLLDSIESMVMGDDLLIGSNLEYARVHQMGSDTIPAREYLGISDKNQLDIEQMVADFIGDLF